MILNTHPENRKEMVKAICELTGMNATYLFIPTYAYQVGPITISRDGSIDCEDEAMIEAMKWTIWKCIRITACCSHFGMDMWRSISGRTIPVRTAGMPKSERKRLRRLMPSTRGEGGARRSERSESRQCHKQQSQNSNCDSSASTSAARYANAFCSSQESRRLRTCFHQQ